MTLLQKLKSKDRTDTDHKLNLSAYYTEAADWRFQSYYSQSVWLKRTLLSTIILAALLFVSLSANFFLFPLKQNVPFLYAVNENTGELSQIGQFKPEKLSQNWLMTRFLLIRYVESRESYDSDNLEQPYQVAWAMSDNAMAKDYADAVRTNNPTSPYAVYNKSKYVTVHVLGIMKLNEDTAAVRFEQTLHDRDAGTEQVIQKETIVKWLYTQPETTEKMLDRDPLGFKITYYRPSQIDTNNPN